MRRISLPFTFTQDYRAASEEPPPLYTESFSIGKVDIAKSKRLTIKNILIQNYIFKSTQALSNPVKLALLLSNNIEKKLNDDFIKLVDFGIGYFDPEDTVAPGEPFPRIATQDIITSFPTIVCYEDIHEYETYIDENDFENPQYLSASAYKLLDENSLIDQYLISTTNISNSEEIEIHNPQGRKYLYIIPFTPCVQRTRVANSGLINFTLISHEDED